MSEPKFKPGDRICNKDTPRIKGVVMVANRNDISLCYTIKWDDGFSPGPSLQSFGQLYRWHKEAIEDEFVLVEDETERTMYKIMYG